MTRKDNKLRPYRVDYFEIPEMKNDRALVRSTCVRAITAQEARDKVLYDHDHFSSPLKGRIIIRSYRYYKPVPQNKEVFKPVEDLFTVNKAVEIMEVVEKYRKVILDQKLAAEPAVESSLKEAQAEACDHGNATNAPISTCNHGESNYEPDSHCIDLDVAAPIVHSAPAAVLVENPNSYTFPDYPVAPTQPAVFDDQPENDPLPVGPFPLFWKLALFGSVAFLAIVTVLSILHVGH